VLQSDESDQSDDGDVHFARLADLPYHRRPVRTRTRYLAAVIITGMTALATLAIAQPRAKPPVKPARPPATKTDAAPGEEATDAATNGPTEPPPASEMTDGGVRPSPLNPSSQELPGANADGGTPIDYDRLLADIAALRARVAAVSDNLYQSRVAVALQTDGDNGKIARLTVSLDDGVVYTAPQSFAASDMTVVYDHAVAPGRHAVTVDVDRKDARDESFRTSQKNRFTVDVPRDHRVTVEVRVIDDSSMGKDFPADKNGRYDLRVKVRAVAKPVGK
jgi:hypothetical protein